MSEEFLFKTEYGEFHKDNEGILICNLKKSVALEEVLKNIAMVNDITSIDTNILRTTYKKDDERVEFVVENGETHGYTHLNKRIGRVIYNTRGFYEVHEIPKSLKADKKHPLKFLGVEKICPIYKKLIRLNDSKNIFR